MQSWNQTGSGARLPIFNRFGVLSGGRKYVVRGCDDADGHGWSHFDIHRPCAKRAGRHAVGFFFNRCLRNGGERGIRTLDRVSPIHAFQACAFNHSAISPVQEPRVFARTLRISRSRAVLAPAPAAGRRWTARRSSTAHAGRQRRPARAHGLSAASTHCRTRSDGAHGLVGRGEARPGLGTHRAPAAHR